MKLSKHIVLEVQHSRRHKWRVEGWTLCGLCVPSSSYPAHSRGWREECSLSTPIIAASSLPRVSGQGIVWLKSFFTVQSDSLIKPIQRLPNYILFLRVPLSPAPTFASTPPLSLLLTPSYVITIYHKIYYEELVWRYYTRSLLCFALMVLPSRRRMLFPVKRNLFSWHTIMKQETSQWTSWLKSSMMDHYIYTIKMDSYQARIQDWSEGGAQMESK